ncbi:hypothetical protein SRABI13_00454 [Erwinia aphidicola]|uniref:hypothetical protein n=1 Tax=Erwinia aphidicola TaxID=68334 RepID=UPI001DF1C9CB|nr:hypothetical protein [Erwinia aphidicola]CAH0148049.1 hypothetical protein SRABI13_00454 [Erwinia aphidicola]
MEMVIKSAGLHVSVDLANNKKAVNLRWLCEALDLNYSTVNTYINREGLTVDAAIKRALSNSGGV